VDVWKVQVQDDRFVAPRARCFQASRAGGGYIDLERFGAQHA
jgi:hypothetical protein